MMVTEKTCFKCLQSLSRDCFYKHPRMSDGLLGKCKDCTKEDTRTYQAENAAKVKTYESARSKTEKRKAASKAYKATPSGKAAQLRGSRNSNARFPGRASARRKLNRALAKGLLVRQPCLACGEPAEAHHPDYSQPLSVTWLCKKHHVEVHQMAREVTSET